MFDEQGNVTDTLSLRLIWFIAACSVRRGKLEALYNVIRRNPSHNWRTGARLYHIEFDTPKPPSGTTEAVAHMYQDMYQAERERPDRPERPVLYSYEREIEGGDQP